MFGTGLARKATKVVVYTAIPVAGPLKAATMGTRNTRLNLKEQRKQTALMEQMAHGSPPIAPPELPATAPTLTYLEECQQADRLRAEQLHAKSQTMLKGHERRWLKAYDRVHAVPPPPPSTS